MKHCSTINIQIDAFPVFMHGTGMDTGISNQMAKLKKLGLNVFVLVGFGSGMKVCPYVGDNLTRTCVSLCVCIWYEQGRECWMRENERTRTNTYTPLVFLVMVYEKQIEVEHRAKQLYPFHPPFPVDHGVGHAEPDERERQTMGLCRRYHSFKFYPPERRDQNRRRRCHSHSCSGGHQGQHELEQGEYMQSESPNSSRFVHVLFTL